MKLLTKTTIYFLAALMLLLGITGFYLFKKFNAGLEQRSDLEMLSNEREWIRYLESQTEGGTSVILRSKEISIFPSNLPAEQFPVIDNAGGLISGPGISIPYRQLSQVVAVGPVNYQIIIKKSQEQKLALIKSFTRIILFVFAGLFLVTLLFSWVISRNLWKPFQRTLLKIRSADLQKMKDLHFEKTNTREFNDLNSSLNIMSGKIYDDYLSMKEFTEDAAHEMQTPIAVVQSKLEILLQDNNLTEEQVRAVMSSSEALSRLARLNQGLLFLAKIQNHQYQPAQTIDLASTTERYLTQFNEVIRERSITVSKNFAEKFPTRLHPVLADSLVSNLLGNAIKYNIQGGTIRIEIGKDRYEITNSGSSTPIAEDKLFKRFAAPREGSAHSNGLGLAIIKKIAETNRLSVDYRYHDSFHSFIITANTA